MTPTQVERTRRYRQKFPIKYRYWCLRHNAKRRKISFTLTLEQFAAVYREGMTIDRIDCLRGYEPGNIQALSRYDNCRKGATVDKYRKQFSKIHVDGVPF